MIAVDGNAFLSLQYLCAGKALKSILSAREKILALFFPTHIKELMVFSELQKYFAFIPVILHSILVYIFHGQAKHLNDLW